MTAAGELGGDTGARVPGGRLRGEGGGAALQLRR